MLVFNGVFTVVASFLYFDPIIDVKKRKET